MISIEGVLGLAVVPLLSVLVLGFVAFALFKTFGLALAKMKTSPLAMRVAERNPAVAGNRRKITERRHISDRRVTQQDRRQSAAA